MVKFQDVDEIDIAVDVPESVMAADIRSADIVQMVAEFSGAPGLQFPVRIKEIAQRADPIDADVHGPRRDEGPARRECAAGHDGHGDRHLSPRQHPGQPDSCADLRGFQR